jgi:PAS domain S-box-containing protein
MSEFANLKREFIEAILNTSNLLIVCLNKDGRIIFFNKKCGEVFGCSGQDVDTDFHDIFPEKIRDEIIEVFKKTMDEGIESFEYIEIPILTRNGKEKIIGWHIKVLKDDAGDTIGILCVGEDVTECKHAEQLLKNLFISSPIGIYIVQDGKFQLINSQFQKITGYSEDELIGKHSLSLVIPEDREIVRKNAVKMLKGERSFPYEYRIVAKDGRIKWILETVTSVKHLGRRASLGNFMDITERKQREEALKTRIRQQMAVAKLSQLALGGADLNELMDEAVTLVAQCLDVEYVGILELLPDSNNLLLRAGVGWKEGVVGQATIDAGTRSQAGYTLLSNEPVIVKDLRTETRFKAECLIQHGVISGISVIIPRKDRPFGVLGAYTSQRRDFTEDDVVFLQAVANVISMAVERKHAEDEIKRLKEFNENIVQSMEEGILIENDEGYITFANPRMLEMLGCSKEELIGRHWTEIFSSEYEREIREIHSRLKKGESVRFEAVLDAGDGEIDVLVSATPLMEEGSYAGNLKVLVDITERKRAEERLRHRFLKYDVEKGRSYLIMEKTLDRGADVFRDLINVGYRGMVISRTPPEEIGELVGEDVEILWLSEKKKGKGVVSPQLLLLEKIIEDFMSRDSVVLLDRLDYLLLLYGFDEVLKFLTKLNEMMYLTKGILLVVVDPDTLSERERIQLEKEIKKIKPKYRIELDKDLFDILNYIKKQNTIGRTPAHKDIMKAFGITRPTATKKIRELKNLGLVVEKKVGRYKVLELTEKGKELM